MFDAGMAEVAVIGFLLTAVAAAVIFSSSWVNVNQRWQVPDRDIDLQSALVTTLAATSAGGVIATGDGRIDLIQRCRPLWASVLAVITLPLGLLLLFIKAEHRLTVIITADERGGHQVDLLGVTRSRTRDAVTEWLVTDIGADADLVRRRL